MNDISKKVVDNMVKKANEYNSELKPSATEVFQKEKTAPKIETETKVSEEAVKKAEVFKNYKGIDLEPKDAKKNSEIIYDIIVIGAGPGGYHTALRAAQYKAKVAIIEKEYLGGTCSNYGCIPTKALYSSAKFFDEIEEKAYEFGINIPQISSDFSKAVERKNKIVQNLSAGIKGLLNARKIPIYEGFGKIISGNKEEGFTVSIEKDGGKMFIKGKNIVIATGSSPSLIPAFNIDHNRIITSDDILSSKFNKIPKSILIIGAGVIGCEFAFILKSFGVEVSILEYLPTMLATEEPRVINFVLKKKLIECCIDLKTSRNVLNIKSTENGIVATTCAASVPRDKTGEAETLTHEAEMCLVSIGRGKESKGIGIEDMGIKIERGAIVVDSKTLESNVPGIYAIGDVNNVGLMLAHVASYQGDVAVSQILNNLGGFDIHIKEVSDKDVVPYTIFTNPEIGSVGMRQKEAKAWAKKNNTKILVGQFYYAGLGKAMCMGEEIGFLMIVVDKKTDLILGATCVGHEAPELISEVTVAIQHGITATQLGHTIHSHPTISEMVLEAVEDVHGMAIHKVGRRK